MDKLIKHSLSDWDINPGTCLNISTDFAVSSPSSLKYGGQGYLGGFDWIFLKEALGKSIPEGRLIWWDLWKYTSGANSYADFLTQALPPSPYNIPEDGYSIYHYYQYFRLYKYTGGSGAKVKQTVPTITLNQQTWYHFRLTWFRFTSADFAVTLRITLELEISGEWVEQLSYDKSPPPWDGTATNLVGYSCWSRNNDNTHYIDDTEIWEKTP